MQHIQRPATEADAVNMAGRLRPSDVAEIQASSGMTPLEALTEGVRLSRPLAWVLCEPVSRLPYVMGGVREVEGCGIVWMLATPAIERHALVAQRAIRRTLAHILDSTEFPALCNIVSASNHKTMPWLKRLGFTFVHMNKAIGTNGELFHSFAKARPYV